MIFKLKTKRIIFLKHFFDIKIVQNIVCNIVLLYVCMYYFEIFFLVVLIIYN